MILSVAFQLCSLVIPSQRLCLDSKLATMFLGPRNSSLKSRESNMFYYGVETAV
jgi:hypothetical protein